MNNEKGTLKKRKQSFDDNFRREYELALQIGKRLFASPCDHKNVKNGYCENCLRKVVSLPGESHR